MTFSEFLKLIYKNKNSNISKQEDFVISLFNSAGSSFYYTPDYAKRLLNGNKPLTNDIRNTVKNLEAFKDVALFFENVINPKRLSDLCEDFKIDKDTKKDLKILCEALSFQFMNYMKYGELNINTTVSNLYESLVDQYGNGRIEDANEKALVLAYNYFLQAVESISDIKVNESVLKLQRPFENFFDSIYKAFKIYNQKCNREGHAILQEMKEHFLIGDNKVVDDYLSSITEPGIEPIILEKEYSYVVYDNYTFKDKFIETTIKLDDKSDIDKIIEEFKNLKFYPLPEIFFTEFICFHKENDSTNLLDQVSKILNKADLILGSIEINLKKDYQPLIEIRKAISDANKNYNISFIQYITDGTYFPDENLIEYAPTMEFFLGDGNQMMKPGDSKFSMEQTKFPWITEKDFKKRVFYVSSMYSFIWKEKKFGQYKDLMAELLTFNEDNTFRYYMIPVTSKARIYRLIREISQKVFDDKMTGFIYSCIMSTYYSKDINEREKIINMKSADRQKYSIDTLCTYGYTFDSKYAYSLTKDQSMKGMLPQESVQNIHIFEPLINTIFARNMLINKKSDTTSKK